MLLTRLTSYLHIIRIYGWSIVQCTSDCTIDTGVIEQRRTECFNLSPSYLASRWSVEIG